MLEYDFPLPRQVSWISSASVRCISMPKTATALPSQVPRLISLLVPHKNDALNLYFCA